MQIGLLTPSFASRRTHARGLTLTEVLIAVTITLVLMAVLVNAFRDISGQISESRAIIQLAGQLRGGAGTEKQPVPVHEGAPIRSTGGPPHWVKGYQMTPGPGNAGILNGRNGT